MQSSDDKKNERWNKWMSGLDNVRVWCNDWFVKKWWTVNDNQARKKMHISRMWEKQKESVCTFRSNVTSSTPTSNTCQCDYKSSYVS